MLRGRRRGLCPTRRSKSFLFIILYLFLLLRASALPVDGDVERNPGPPPSSSISNLNSNLNVVDGTHSTTTATPTAVKHDNRKLPSPSGLTKRLRLLQFNARRLLNKWTELQQTVMDRGEEAPTIIAVTETWLNDQVPDSSLTLPGYSAVFRTDRRTDNRRGCRGGGVLLLAAEV